MKGKAQKGVKASQKLSGDFYSGASSSVARSAKDKAEGFKRGGKTVMSSGEKAMPNAGRKARKSGGGVMSSAAKGTPRPGFGG